jgi:4-alpha-glucanotransferase
MAQQHLLERQAERDDLIDALSQAGIQPTAAMEDDDEAISLSVSAYKYVALSRSLLVAVRLADLTNEPDPTNIPGTSGSYPNWRPKLSVPLEALGDTPLFRQVIATMRQLRPR